MSAEITSGRILMHSIIPGLQNQGSISQKAIASRFRDTDARLAGDFLVPIHSQLTITQRSQSI
jgi:hypothetical protein